MKLQEQIAEAKELLAEKDAEIERLKEILDTINNQLNDTK